MPLSIQGNEVLSKMYTEFRTTWVEANPGMNENDVERVFLHLILACLVDHSEAFSPYSNELSEVEVLIEKIR
jgi:hypothetical protein